MFGISVIFIVIQQIHRINKIYKYTITNSIIDIHNGFRPGI